MKKSNSRQQGFILAMTLLSVFILTSICLMALESSQMALKIANAYWRYMNNEQSTLHTIHNIELQLLAGTLASNCFAPEIDYSTMPSLFDSLEKTQGCINQEKDEKILVEVIDNRQCVAVTEDNVISYRQLIFYKIHLQSLQPALYKGKSYYAKLGNELPFCLHPRKMRKLGHQSMSLV